MLIDDDGSIDLLDPLCEGREVFVGGISILLSMLMRLLLISSEQLLVKLLE